jgi:hypothetical protein
MKKPYPPTGILFAGKSHVFSPRDPMNYNARSLSEQESRLLLACRKGRRPLSTDNEQPQATFSP